MNFVSGTPSNTSTFPYKCFFEESIEPKFVFIFICYAMAKLKMDKCEGILVMILRDVKHIRDLISHTRFPLLLVHTPLTILSTSF